MKVGVHEVGKGNDGLNTQGNRAQDTKMVGNYIHYVNQNQQDKFLN